MGGKRQNTGPEQMGLALQAEVRSEAPSAALRGAETPTAKRAYEGRADTERLMEEVCERGNCEQAWKRVKFDSLGLPRLTASQLNPPNRRMRTRMSGGVAGARG